MNLNQILSNLSNKPYKKLTPDEETQLKEIELSVKRDVKAFSGLAKELFDDLRYKKLKDEFKKVYEQNMRLIIYFDCDDPNKYLMKMREYQVQLRTLKSIFEVPEGFIKSSEALEKKTMEENR